MFLTLPVTVATAERSFSKLKFIKNYLRNSMGQERLNALALLSIEASRAKVMDVDLLIDRFAEIKSRRKDFVLLLNTNLLLIFEYITLNEIKFSDIFNFIYNI